MLVDVVDIVWEICQAEVIQKSDMGPFSDLTTPFPASEFNTQQIPGQMSFFKFLLLSWCCRGICFSREEWQQLGQPCRRKLTSISVLTFSFRQYNFFMEILIYKGSQWGWRTFTLTPSRNCYCYCAPRLTITLEWYAATSNMNKNEL